MYKLPEWKTELMYRVWISAKAAYIYFKLMLLKKAESHFSRLSIP